MKKTILLLFIVVLFTGLKAQDSGESGSGGGLFIGIKGGYGIVDYESTLKGVNDFAKISYDNFSYVIVTGYKLNGHISFQLEGNYAQYGAHNIIPTYIYSPLSPVLANYGSNSVVDHVDIDIFNVDVPLTLKVTMGKGDVSPYIYAGVNYGINVLGRALIVRKITFNENVDYQTSSDDITPRIIINEFAPVGGCGVIINMNKSSFFIDARYKYGYTNISNVDNHLGFTSNAIWISAGLVFNL
jgi:hypothetical protein